MEDSMVESVDPLRNTMPVIGNQERFDSELMKSEIVSGSRQDEGGNVRDSLKKGIKGLFKKAKQAEQLTPGNLRNSMMLGKSVTDKQIKEATG